MVRMVRSHDPDVGAVVMAEVVSVSRNYLSLPEYGVGADLDRKVPVAANSCRIEPLVSGRFEPVSVVRSSRLIKVVSGIWPARMSRLVAGIKPRRFSFKWKLKCTQVSRNVSVPDIHACEGRFALRKHIRDILSLVSERLGMDLEVLYETFDWPQTLADLENNQHSNLIPIELRSCLSECMARMNYFSVRIRNPHLLAPTWRYQNGWCYAVAMIRQFEAILKRYELIEPDIFLSVQDLINQIPTTDRLDEGDISSLSAAEGALLAGITTEQFCPLGSPQRLPGGPVFRLEEFTVAYDCQYSPRGWDNLIEALLNIGGGVPFTAGVLWFPSYTNITASEEVYRPTNDEVRMYADDPSCRGINVHTVLLTGRGTDKYGTQFLEFQDTTAGDINNGDRGYIRFARYNPCPVVEVVTMVFSLD